MKRLVLSIGVALLALATGASGQESGAPKGDPVRGRAAWMADNCFACHGRQGQGGYGPTIAATSLEWEGFEYFVRNPQRIMPAYSTNTVSEAELADIYAFVKTLPGPKPVKGSSMMTPTK